MVWYVLCFVKRETAYELRISDWSSDVCSADLSVGWSGPGFGPGLRVTGYRLSSCVAPTSCVAVCVTGAGDPRESGKSAESADRTVISGPAPRGPATGRP